MTRIEHINRALVRIGSNPLQTDETRQALQHVEIYQGVVERLAASPFSFLKATQRLVQLPAAADPRFAYAYRLPPGMLGAPRAVYAQLPSFNGGARPITSYDISGEVLLSDCDQIWIVFTTLANPDRWPGDFRELVTLAMMAEMALSVREDRPMHDRLYQKAFGSPGQNGMGGLFAATLDADNQALPSDPVGNEDSPLLDARFVGGDRWERY